MTFFNRVVTDDSFHHEIELGNGYNISGIFDPAASPVTIYFDNTTNIKNLHATFSMSTDNDAQMRLYENPGVTVNGTTMPIIQLNRTSTNVSGLMAYHTPTLGGSPPLGNVLREVFIPAGGTTNGSGFTNGLSRGEWVLAAGNSYLIQVTFATAAVIAGDFTFYEAD